MTTRGNYYQTKAAAESAAHRAARQESPSRSVNTVEFASGIMSAVEGGKGFEVRAAPFDEFELVALSAVEVEARVQAGIHRAVLDCYEAAALEDAAAEKAAAAKPNSCFVLMHQKWAAEHRERARGLERRLKPSPVLVQIIAECVEILREARL